MSRTFEKILSITLLHDYYNSGITTDFVITPTTATKQLLKNHRWICKHTANGCFIGCDNLGVAMLPLILAQKTLRFSFILKLRNNNLMNFTALPPRSGSKDSYYLHSQEGSEEMAMETVTCHPPVFTYKFLATGDTTNIQVKDPKGNTCIQETFTGSPGQQLSMPVNVEGLTPGLYRFTVSGQPDKNIYITAEPQHSGSFGILEITLPSDFNPQTSGAYWYQFNARNAVWAYHLLLGKDYSGYSLAIEDTLEGILFTETEVPPNYNKGSRIIFTAQTPLPYREAARKGLQLVITAGDGTSSTHNHLPGPSVSNPESKVYLTI